jgi:biofilm PGA synthesis lipoprotein PgaB
MLSIRIANTVLSYVKLIQLLVVLGFVTLGHANENRFLVLNYHDIVGPEGAKPPYNALDVSIDHFEEQLLWLKKNNYRIISVQNLLDAAAGNYVIPSKAILLTFDDGYQSFYTRIFPLLKKHHYSATIALVGNWMDGKEKPDEPGKQLVTWDQVREMLESGLVEVASHSYDFHNSSVANPQGNQQATVVTRLYDKAKASYETEDQYRNRIRQALLRSSEFIFQHTGIRPRVLVWPFGEYNEMTVAAAREAGMPITMELNDGSNTLADIAALRRLIMVDNPVGKQFADLITQQRGNQILRVAHLDMDYLYDDDPSQTERNVDAAVQRIKNMHINTVYLQAYADPDGDGNADALYFPNRHLPVKQDLFNRVAWQLKSIARVKVYAWLPILAYQNKLPESWYVQEWRDGKAQKSRHIYTRLSPFQPEARQFVAEIYEDLAKYCSFDGVLFHDDGILSDYEDASPFALSYAKSVWGLPDQFEMLHATPPMRLAWAQHKTELINQFTDELANRVRYYRPYIKTARNMYALPLLKPFSEEWYAQSYPSFLAHYDYVAIEAMPFMEEAQNPSLWLNYLVKAAGKHKNGLEKTVFELQSVDWKSQDKLAMSTFVQQLELLKTLGAIHIGYYPDNLYTDQPRLADLQQKFSLVVSP